MGEFYFFLSVQKKIRGPKKIEEGVKGVFFFLFFFCGSIISFGGGQTFFLAWVQKQILEGGREDQ